MEYGPYGVIALFAAYIINRLNKVETRLDAAEKDNRRLQSWCQALCTGYRNVRADLMMLVAALRAGRPLSEAELARIEATPTVEDLLNEPGLGQPSIIITPKK